MTALGVVELAWVAAALLASGLIVLGGLLLTPRGRPLAKSLAGSAGSLVVTIAVLFTAFLGGTLVLGVFFLALAARIGFEAASVRLGATKALVVALAASLAALIAMSAELGAIALAGLWMVLFGRLIGLPWAPESRIKTIIELAVYPILPVALLAYGALDETLRPIVLVAYILIETFDSYALVFGKLFGRRHAFPILSPKKTVEGLVGGAATLVLTVVCVALAVGVSVPGAAAFAVLVGGAGLVGDLSASRLKRAGGVKDFPVVLGHQGGALDIFDSWIAVGAGIGLLSILFGLA